MDRLHNPDVWRPGDYAMNAQQVRSKLSERTNLILEDINESAPAFFCQYNPLLIGLLAEDLDLYSSTKDALKFFVSQ